MNLGKHLEEHRKRALLTQDDLATQTGLGSRQTIARIEAGDGTLRSFMIILGTLSLSLLGLPRGDTLGDRLRGKRTQQGLTQRELAARAQVALPTLVSLETRSAGRMHSFEKVCRALGADIRLRAGRSYHDKGETDAWDTPAWICEALHEVFGSFDLDPCSSPTSHVRADRTFYENGLQQEWPGSIYLNPPYSECTLWVERASKAFSSGEARLVAALLPADRTNTRWFQIGRAHV